MKNFPSGFLRDVHTRCTVDIINFNCFISNIVKRLMRLKVIVPHKRYHENDVRLFISDSQSKYPLSDNVIQYNVNHCRIVWVHNVCVLRFVKLHLVVVKSFIIHRLFYHGFFQPRNWLLCQPLNF